MHILFLTHYFPPEVNAPASRTFENAKRWVQNGHCVTVITCVPSHPNGIVYPGYKDKWRQWDEIEGIKVLRIKTYISANKGFIKRILNYFTYMLSASLFCGMVRDVDVVVSTSPQFFCGMAGLWVSLRKRCKWVLEIRDLWPESIIAVGAIKSRFVINVLTRLEVFLYSSARHIISVTHSFKRHIAKMGIPSERISIVTNGADLDQFQPQMRNNGIRGALGLDDKFIVSYIGTHGMAHHLETVLEAAGLLTDRKQIVFLLVGGGAERDRLLQLKAGLQLDNLLMLPQQPKELMPQFLAASDACMVLLKKNDLFKTVIPSKIFEAMAMERPLILGVEGESREIVEKARCGICIEPENHRELADAVLQLYENRNLGEYLGTNGRDFVVRHFSRDVLAGKYIDVLQQILEPASPECDGKTGITPGWKAGPDSLKSPVSPYKASVRVQS
jgi:glycosyltransferase involved in cell wall biosynthesis